MLRLTMGYPSSLATLAQAVLESGQEDLNMTVVITTAEPLYDFQRTVIARAFGCPVRETYGMTEIVVAASECAASRLHLWPEVGWVEVMECNESLPRDATGDLVCTGLLNTDMPLIRYKVGDRGGVLFHLKIAVAAGRFLRSHVSRAEAMMFYSRQMDGASSG